MDAQSLLGLIQVTLGIIFVMVCVNLYLIFRLKDIDPFAKWNPHAINGTLFLSFLILGTIAAFWSSSAYLEKMILVQHPASAHGIQIDRMFSNTMWVAVFVTVVTNILLFYFAFRYRKRDGQKATYYPHNTILELIWTAAPAIVLTFLIVDGILVWHDIVAEPEDNAIQIEMTGEQFLWNIRYPGADKEFGEAHVSFIDLGSGNTLGFNWEDEKGRDDVIAQELWLPVGREINMNIRSKDVLHSMTMAHFRVKMDAVPGLTTNFKFTPTVTTDSMRQATGNPEFEYELSCQQICGRSHWNMRKIIKVVSYEDYLIWKSEQKPFFATWLEMNNLTEQDMALKPTPQTEEEESVVEEESQEVAEKEVATI
ncbi:MAG: cytochrome c oxidase subunit II [Bacteroidota bacterium]